MEVEATAVKATRSKQAGTSNPEKKKVWLLAAW